MKHWHAWIGEPAAADAMLDRLLARAERLILKGESLRPGRKPAAPAPSVA